MGQKTINTFYEGIDTDTSQNKRSNASYYDALDLRIISNDALSNGAMVNFKGPLSKISTALSSLYIVGYASVRDTLVLFSYQSSTGDSFIHEVTVDSSNNVQNTSLVYTDSGLSNKLNFNPDNKIDAIGRYESDTIKKVYWADGSNELRSLNLNTSYVGKDPSVFSITPNHDMSSNFTSEIIPNSGNYKAGVVYYAYQFYSLNGASSTLKYHNFPSKLSKYSEASDGGSELGENSGCSIRITISDISSETLSAYNRIRLYAIVYSEKDSPVVNIIKESPIYETSISIIDSGSVISASSVEEIVFMNEISYSPAVLSSKDNILLAGNIKEKSFDSNIIDDWDSRAYRFTNPEAEYATIYNSDLSKYIVINSDYTITSYISGTPGAVIGGQVPPDFDCMHEANLIFTKTLQERSSGSDSLLDKVYNNLGTEGGEGPNIRYEFLDATRELTNSDSYDPNDQSLYLKGTDFLKNSQSDIYDIAGELDDYAMLECQAGEVYRIGIVFYNKKGQRSFAKWIGDVLWEESSSSKDEYELIVDPSLAFSLSLQSKCKVLKVTVKELPSDPDIVGWQVVRAPRRDTDRSVVANGLTRLTHKNVGEDFYRAPYSSHNTSATSTAESLYKFSSPDLMFNSNDGNDFTGYRLRVPRYYHSNNSAETLPSGINYRSQSLGASGTAYVSSYGGSASTLLWTDNDTEIKASKYVTPDHAQIDFSNEFVTVGGDKYLNQISQFAASVEGEQAGASSGVILKVSERPKIDSSYDIVNGLGRLVKNTDYSRYGGVTYGDIQNTTYAAFSNINPVSKTSSICVYGDVVSSIYYYLEGYFFDDPNSTFEGRQDLIAVPLQSRADTRKRLDRIVDFYTDLNSISAANSMFIQETVSDGLKLSSDPSAYDVEIGDLYRYNPVYSQSEDRAYFYSKPIDFSESEVNDVKVIASEKKTNGENFDSWTTFSANNFIEVDSAYGAITGLKYFKNSIYFFQDLASGRLSVNDRTLISGDSSGSSLALGTGGVLDRFDYVNQNSGASDFRHIITSGKELYYVDSVNKSIQTISSMNSLSKNKGISSAISSLISDNINNICLGNDSIFKEILFTINGTTFCFNEDTEKFTSRYSVTPGIYINGMKALMSSPNLGLPESIIYKHNSGDVGGSYGGPLSTSKISILVNPNGNIINSFASIDFRTDVYSGSTLLDDTVDRIKFKNSYIPDLNKDIITSGTGKNASLLVRAYNTQVPLTANGNRFVDSYILITLEFDNVSNNTFRLHDVITRYTQSNNR